MLLFAKYLMCFMVLFRFRACFFIDSLIHTQSHGHIKSRYFRRRAHSSCSVCVMVCINILWFPNESPPSLLTKSEQPRKEEEKENNFRIFIVVVVRLVFLFFSSFSLHFGLSIFKTQKSFPTLFCIAAIVVLRFFLVCLLLFYDCDLLCFLLWSLQFT